MLRNKIGYFLIATLCVSNIPLYANTQMETMEQIEQDYADSNTTIPGLPIQEVTTPPALEVPQLLAELPGTDTIATPEDWNNLATLINTDASAYAGKTLIITADLDFTDTTFIPINYFEGTIDGMGHSISNVSLTAITDDKAYGLIKELKGSVLDLNLTDIMLDITFSKSDSFIYMGGLVGKITNSETVTPINQVTMTNITIKSNAPYVGGLAGILNTPSDTNIHKISNVTLTNCNIGSASPSSTGKKGGLFGVVYNNVEFSMITLDGIYILNTSSDIGGIAAVVWRGTTYVPIRVSEINTTRMHFESGGSVGGLFYNVSSAYVISDCNIESTTEINSIGTGGHYGGVVAMGYGYNSPTESSIDNCIIKATLTNTVNNPESGSSKYLDTYGGAIGSSYPVNFTNNTVNFDVTINNAKYSNYYRGGAIGELESDNLLPMQISDNTVTTNVTYYNAVYDGGIGGLVGQVNSLCNIVNNQVTLTTTHIEPQSTINKSTSENAGLVLLFCVDNLDATLTYQISSNTVTLDIENGITSGFISQIKNFNSIPNLKNIDIVGNTVTGKMHPLASSTIFSGFIYKLGNKANAVIAKNSIQVAIDTSGLVYYNGGSLFICDKGDSQLEAYDNLIVIPELILAPKITESPYFNGYNKVGTFIAGYLSGVRNLYNNVVVINCDEDTQKGLISLEQMDTTGTNTSNYVVIPNSDLYSGLSVEYDITQSGQVHNFDLDWDTTWGIQNESLFPTLEPLTYSYAAKTYVSKELDSTQLATNAMNIYDIFTSLDTPITYGWDITVQNDTTDVIIPVDDDYNFLADTYGTYTVTMSRTIPTAETVVCTVEIAKVSASAVKDNIQGNYVMTIGEPNLFENTTKGSAVFTTSMGEKLGTSTYDFSTMDWDTAGTYTVQAKALTCNDDQINIPENLKDTLVVTLTIHEAQLIASDVKDNVQGTYAMTVGESPLFESDTVGEAVFTTLKGDKLGTSTYDFSTVTWDKVGTYIVKATTLSCNDTKVTIPEPLKDTLIVTITVKDTPVTEVATEINNTPKSMTILKGTALATTQKVDVVIKSSLNQTYTINAVFDLSKVDTTKVGTYLGDLVSIESIPNVTIPDTLVKQLVFEVVVYEKTPARPTAPSTRELIRIKSTGLTVPYGTTKDELANKLPQYVDGYYSDNSIGQVKAWYDLKAYNGTVSGEHKVTIWDADTKSVSTQITITVEPNKVNKPIAPILEGYELDTTVEFYDQTEYWYVNQVQQDYLMDKTPYIKDNSRIFLPVRYVAYALGIDAANVEWNPKDRTAIITDNDTVLTVTVGSPILDINGEKVTCDAAPTLEDGRVMLPMRHIADAFKQKKVIVDWSNDLKGVYIHLYKPIHN